MTNFLIISKLGGMGNRFCGGRVHRQTGKPQKCSWQPSVIAGSRRLSGSLAAFFVSNPDNEFRVPVVRLVGEGSAVFLYSGDPGFKLSLRLAVFFRVATLKVTGISYSLSVQ
jgi:hypothetical protein